MSSTTELQDQVLDGIRQSQTAVIEAVRSFTEAMPAAPATPQALPADLPSPADLIAGSFDFAQKLLETQRAFAEELVAATAPVAQAVPATNGKPAKKRASA